MVDQREMNRVAAFFLLGWCKQHALTCDNPVLECDTCQGYLRALDHGRQYAKEA